MFFINFIPNPDFVPSHTLYLLRFEGKRSNTIYVNSFRFPPITATFGSQQRELFTYIRLIILIFINMQSMQRCREFLIHSPTNQVKITNLFKTEFTSTFTKYSSSKLFSVQPPFSTLSFLRVHALYSRKSKPSH